MSRDFIVIGHDKLSGIYEVNERGAMEKGFIERGGKERAMRYSLAAMQLKHLLGEILTVVEASIERPEKVKAVKSLVRDKFHRKMDWIYELCNSPESQQSHLASEQGISAHAE